MGALGVAHLPEQGADEATGAGSEREAEVSRVSDPSGGAQKHNSSLKGNSTGNQTQRNTPSSGCVSQSEKTRIIVGEES